jgi:hypothetical protein
MYKRLELGRFEKMIKFIIGGLVVNIILLYNGVVQSYTTASKFIF